jgi:hypothetical protein
VSESCGLFAACRPECLPLWLEHQLRICRVELAFALIAAWLKTGDPDGAAAFPRNKDFVSSRAGKRPIENQAVLAVSHAANANPDLPQIQKELELLKAANARVYAGKRTPWKTK